MQKVVTLVDDAIEFIKTKKEEQSQPKLLLGESRSALQLTRKYSQGKGARIPSDEHYRTCVFCRHSFVDYPPENDDVLKKNTMCQLIKSFWIP